MAVEFSVNRDGEVVCIRPENPDGARAPEDRFSAVRGSADIGRRTDA